MPTVGPIAVPSGQDVVRFAAGYFDYNADGTEVAALTTDAYVTGIFLMNDTEPFDSHTTNSLVIAAAPADGGLALTVATVPDMSDSVGGGSGTTNILVWDANGVAVFSAASAFFLSSGYIVRVTYNTGAATPTHGTAYLMLQYIELPV